MVDTSIYLKIAIVFEGVYIIGFKNGSNFSNFGQHLAKITTN